MARGKAVSGDLRKTIINLHNSGQTGRNIARNLKLPSSTVADIIKKFKTVGSVEIGKSPGRSPTITQRDIRVLLQIIKQNRRSNLREISRIWSERLGRTVCIETTRKYLSKNGYKFYKAKEKPLLTTKQKRNRLQWAKDRSNWTQRQWENIIFSDESKFDVCVGDMRKRVIRKRKSSETYHKDCLKRMVKFPASIMVWGCMSRRGLGQLHFIDGTVNAQKYIQILERTLLPSIGDLVQDADFIFQHDGTACHTAKSTKTWLHNQSINTMEWPSSSPDMNPIESLWGIMKRRLRSQPQRTIPALRQKIVEIWNSIPPNECQRLLDSMPARIAALIAAKGDVTKY